MSGRRCEREAQWALVDDLLEQVRQWRAAQAPMSRDARDRADQVAMTPERGRELAYLDASDRAQAMAENCRCACADCEAKS